MRLFRVVQFAAAPRSGVIFGGSRKARPPQPPKINTTHALVGEQQAKNRKCSPQDCAGRSLAPAEARCRSRMLTRGPRRLRPECDPHPIAVGNLNRIFYFGKMSYLCLCKQFFVLPLLLIGFVGEIILKSMRRAVGEQSREWHFAELGNG